MTWLGLEDKIVIVTGGSGGIGQACLTAFYEAGARVVSLDYTYDKAEEAAAKLDPTGKRALGLGCDVGDADAVQAAADAAGVHFGPADVVVNNAGILRPAGLETIAEADWMQLLQVNLNGSLLVAQAFGRQMIAKGAGAIVQIASIAGTQPQPSSGAYSASKAAVLMMIRQLAYEWGPKGLRANSVSPGLVITPLSAAFYDDPKVRAAREKLVPIGRIGRAEDMAEAALFLGSDRSSYINGQNITVDGGLSQSLMGSVPRPGFEAN